MRLTQPPEMEAVEYHHDAIVPSRRALAAFVAGYRVPLLAWVLHLALVFAVAAVGVANFYTLNAVPAIGFALPPMSGIAHYTIQPLRNWDGFWYALVALYGYGVYQASAAFWPLYPFLLRIGVEVTNWSVPVVGVLISNLAFLGALCLLYKLVTLEVSRTVAARTIWLIAFFPTAFFFSAVYTESLFLLVTVAAIYLARTGRWWWAGFFGFLAALTRNTGILILIPLGLLLLQERGWDPRRWWRQALGLTPVLLGPLLFFAELKHVWGDPLLTLHAQKGWARYRAMPWETLQTEWHKLDLTWFWYLVQHPTWDVLSNPNIRYLFAERQAYDLFIFVLFVPLTLYMLWRERPAYSLYALVSFVVPLFSPSLVHPLMSYPRFVIVLFPFFIALARLTRNRWVFSLLLALCLVQFAGLLIQFSTWFWVA